MVDFLGNKSWDALVKKGTAGENVTRWFSYCSSQVEFKKIQKLVSNNSQAANNTIEKKKPSHVGSNFIISLLFDFQ